MVLVLSAHSSTTSKRLSHSGQAFSDYSKQFSGQHSWCMKCCDIWEYKIPHCPQPPNTLYCHDLTRRYEQKDTLPTIQTAKLPRRIWARTRQKNAVFCVILKQLRPLLPIRWSSWSRQNNHRTYHLTLSKLRK